jgi:hypothetical protein
MIDKYQWRRIRADIRRVLLDEWDPIGIRDQINAQDEYDAYIGQVYKLLVSGATDRQITDWLLFIVRERMGLDAATPEAMTSTVRALRTIQLS